MTRPVPSDSPSVQKRGDFRPLAALLASLAFEPTFHWLWQGWGVEDSSMKKMRNPHILDLNNTDMDASTAKKLSMRIKAKLFRNFAWWGLFTNFTTWVFNRGNCFLTFTLMGLILRPPWGLPCSGLCLVWLLLFSPRIFVLIRFLFISW